MEILSNICHALMHTHTHTGTPHDNFTKRTHVIQLDKYFCPTVSWTHPRTSIDQVQSKWIDSPRNCFLKTQPRNQVKKNQVQSYCHWSLILTDLVVMLPNFYWPLFTYSINDTEPTQNMQIASPIKNANNQISQRRSGN